MIGSLRENNQSGCLSKKITLIKNDKLLKKDKLVVISPLPYKRNPIYEIDYQLTNIIQQSNINYYFTILIQHLFHHQIYTTHRVLVLFIAILSSESKPKSDLAVNPLYGDCDCLPVTAIY